jgi:alcohol dehydrogenase
MRAVVLREHGGVDALRYEDDYPDPQPEAGQVVVRVRATSINYHDVFTCKGMPGIKVPFPCIIGLDIAGEIASVGPGVTGAWKPGDRVLVDPLNLKRVGLHGETLPGGCAELCPVDEEQLVPIPDGVSFEQAAALPVAYGSAHRMIMTHGKIKAGEKVLILGASGGVGSCCVQLAKMVGCEVVACGSTPEKLAALKAMGADHVIDYKAEDFAKAVYALYDKPHRRFYTGGVDVLVNFTGGETWVPSLKCIKRGGRLLTCGATAGFDPKEDLRYIWTFELQILGSNSWARQDLVDLMNLIRDKRLDPHIETVLPLEETREGVRKVRDREAIGKIVIRP